MDSVESDVAARCRVSIEITRVGCGEGAVSLAFEVVIGTDEEAAVECDELDAVREGREDVVVGVSDSSLGRVPERSSRRRDLSLRSASQALQRPRTFCLLE